jgi:hypothetical protein
MIQDYQLTYEPYGTSYIVRENLVDILERELLGPIHGPTEVLPFSPRSQYLEQADRGAQRPRDEVQLVLNDQIRRTQPLNGTHRGRRVTACDGEAGGDGAAGVIGMHIAVAAAVPADVAEQRRGLAFAGQPGELVDRGDYERRCQPIDLLIMSAQSGLRKPTQGSHRP